MKILMKMNEQSNEQPNTLMPPCQTALLYAGALTVLALYALHGARYGRWY